jgi:hypothetical protein
MYQQFPESVWVEPAYRCAAADGCKTTTFFSAFKNCSRNSMQCMKKKKHED